MHSDVCTFNTVVNIRDYSVESCRVALGWGLQHSRRTSSKTGASCMGVWVCGCVLGRNFVAEVF